MRCLEVLFEGNIIDEATPVSEDGVEFLALVDAPVVLARLREVAAMLRERRDPWSGQADARGDGRPKSSPSAPPRSSSGARPLSAEAENQKPLRAMLRAAVDKASGVLTAKGPDGEICIRYRDGKIVAVETTTEPLSLPSFLAREKIVDAPALEKARTAAPSMGGDVGGALIALGLIPPHTYFEKLLTWAKETAGMLVVGTFDEVTFTAQEVANPPIPLGLDRFGVLMELVRARADRAWLHDRLLPKRPCPLIPSHVEGAKLEDLKLTAAETRVMNAINGAKTLGDLIDALGGSEQKALEILRVVHLAEQTGLCVFGQDPLVSKEMQEAQRVRELLESWKDKTFFDVLGVTAKSTDEETRAKYAELAKQHHPDKLRSGAAQELIEARQAIFASINEAFALLETEAKRQQYANDVAAGRKNPSEEAVKVQNALHAETLFKKAEVLGKVRKFDEAVAFLDDAISLKSDDLELKVFREYFALRQAQKVGQPVDVEATIRNLQGLMKGAGNLISGFLFLAYLCKEAGKADSAHKYFEKVLDLDEHHAEALREIRLANMRAEKAKKKKWF